MAEQPPPDGRETPQGEPAPDGPDGPEGPPGSLRDFTYYLPYLFRSRGVVVLLLASIGLLAVLRLPLLFLPQQITEHFDDKPYLATYLIFVLVSVLAWAGVKLASAYMGTWLGERVVFLIRKDGFDRLERLNMLSVFARGPGQFVQQLDRDVYAVKGLLESTLIQTLVDLATGAALLVSLIALDPLLTAISLVVFLVIGLMIRYFNVFVRKYATQGRVLSESITSALVECIGGFRDIQASGRFPHYAQRYQERVAESARTNVRTQMWNEMGGLLPYLGLSLIVLGVYATGLFGHNKIESVAQVGALVTFAMMLNQLFPAVMAASHWSTDLAMVMPSLVGLRQILDQPDPQAGRTDLRRLEPPIRDIRFERVSLVIDDQPLVQDLSFTIPGGKFTAIIGQSGAGKTTVFHLLLRLLEPTAGRILINGVPLNDLTMESVRAHLGFIPQRAFIFNTTLRDNLLLAAPESALKAGQLQGAIDFAQLGELIEKRHEEGGLDAVAGYLGNRLSGGEQQRIALGRLFLQSPQVIICDEYTANIDVKTEKLIHEAMRTRFADRTRVVITHQLHTIRGADHIIVLEYGRVVDAGTHEELLSRPGTYRDLWSVQQLSER
jgi:ATP-binding cassette subfamily B protein